MTQDELKEAIGTINKAIMADTPESANEAKFQAVGIVAIAVLGELVLDIKRIADAAEAMKDTLRSIDQG